MAKDINFGIGARAAMLLGVTELAEAVKVTMGPKVPVYILEFLSYLFPLVIRERHKSMLWEGKDILAYDQ